MKIRIRCMVLVSLLLSIQAYAQNKCEKPTSVSQLAQAGHDGERAFADMDEVQLKRQAAFARDEILPCLNETLLSKDASAFHRLMAMEAFMRQNDKRALVEFHAARRLFPGYVLPEDLFGPEQKSGDTSPEHPLRKLYVQAQNVDDGPQELVNPPEDGYVTVGGVRNAPHFKNMPVIVQVFGKDGKVLETRYFQPGETLPKWGRNNPLGVTALDLGIDTRSTLSKPNTWWIATAVASVIATGFYSAALYEKHQFNDRSTPDGDLSGHRDRANGFGYTALATGGLAIISAGLGISMQMKFGGDDSPTIEPSAWMPNGPSMERNSHVFK